MVLKLLIRLIISLLYFVDHSVNVCLHWNYFLWRDGHRTETIADWLIRVSSLGSIHSSAYSSVTSSPRTHRTVQSVAEQSKNRKCTAQHWKTWPKRWNWSSRANTRIVMQLWLSITWDFIKTFASIDWRRSSTAIRQQFRLWPVPQSLCRTHNSPLMTKVGPTISWDMSSNKRWDKSYRTFMAHKN